MRFPENSPTRDYSADTMPLLNAKIAVCDDDSAVVRQLSEALTAAGFSSIRGITDPRQVLGVFTSFAPDLIVLDVHMRYLDGIWVIRQLSTRGQESIPVPIMCVTNDQSREIKHKALAAGAREFLTKPCDPDEFILRVKMLLSPHFTCLALQRRISSLEAEVLKRRQEMETVEEEVLERLTRAACHFDAVTTAHAERVGQLAGELADALGASRQYVALLKKAAYVHDVGKIGIPGTILNKAGALDSEERERVGFHTLIGAELLSGGRSKALQLAEEVALYHHERWDGTGYCGLRGDEIPLSARITAVADAYDALTHDRPYRKGIPAADAWDLIAAESGKQFDPEVVSALGRLLEDLPDVGHAERELLNSRGCLPAGRNHPTDILP